ncbi:MAG TPA: PilZ domain-containing protein [Ignavibacteriaceae bacterium]
MAAIKMTFSGENRRKDERFPLSLSASLIEPAGNYVQTIDISEHGIAFHCDTMLVKGCTCQLVLQIPDPLGPLDVLVLPLRIQDAVSETATVRVSAMVELRKLSEEELNIFNSLVLRTKESFRKPWEGLEDGEIPLPSSNANLQFWD